MLSRRLLCSLALLISPVALVAAEPLPDGAVARLGDLRLRHEHPVLAAAFSPDGKLLAAADAGRAIVVWDTATGDEVRRLNLTLPGRPWGLRFSPDGKSLLVAGDNGTFHLVDAVTGKEQRNLSPEQRKAVLSLDVSRDGKTAVTVHYPDTVVTWDLAAGKRLHEFKGSGKMRQPSSEGIALTPDGKQLVLPHADGSLHLADVASGKETVAFEMPLRRQGNPQFVYFQKVAISPDGQYLAYGSGQNAAALCDLKTGKRLREFPPQAGISGLAFTPNSRFLAVGTYSEISLFGVISGKEVRKLPQLPGTTGNLLFSPDGRKLAIAGSGPNNVASPTIRLWDVVAGRRAPEPVGHAAPVHSLAFSADGKRLASAGPHGDLIFWDVGGGREIARHRSIPFPRTLGVSADGASVHFLASDWTFHRWWPGSDRDETRRALPPLATNQPVLSPDGRYAAAATHGTSQHIHVQDIEEGKAVATLPLPEKSWMTRLTFSAGGRRLTAATSDNVLRLWDCASGKLVRELPPDAPGRGAAQMAVAGDGRSVAVFDTQVRIREIISGGVRLVIDQPGGVFALAYSPDGRFLAWGQPDGGITLRGTVSGKELAHWKGGQGTTQTMAFSRDGRLLASGGANGTILVWKVPPGEELPATLPAKEADALWQTLADVEAAPAGRAIAALSAAPAQAVPLIKERFRAERKRLTKEEIARLITDLDADAFKVREKATRSLIEAGPDAAEALRKALAADPSPELKGRIASLLDRLSKGGDPERLRGLRAIEILERIGTPEAKDVLREFSRRKLPADFTDEIQASLQRLGDPR